MTDFPFSQSQPANSAGKIATVLAGLIALFRSAHHAAGHALAQQLSRRAQRRSPDAILMAHARREEARRAVDRLLLLR